jgi:hypothetical protein
MLCLLYELLAWPLPAMQGAVIRPGSRQLLLAAQRPLQHCRMCADRSGLRAQAHVHAVQTGLVVVVSHKGLETNLGLMFICRT